MARGNLFQGMARGKIGDVVFYRMNGIQMSRVRNRTPKNPRSNEQLYQRAVIATTMKAYSACKEIFDHAFQGYTVGEGCMRRFNSVNARIIRSGLIAQLNNEPSINDVSFVAPKSLFPVPVPGLQISEGTLKNELFIAFKEEGDEVYSMNVSKNDIAATTVNEFLRSKGTYAGDIYTFVYTAIDQNNIVYKAPWDDTGYTKQFATYYTFCRLIIKSNIPDTLTLETAKYSDIFEIQTNDENIVVNGNASFSADAGVPISNTGRLTTVTAGVIRSRIDEDIRSTAYMYPVYDVQYGIKPQQVLLVWQNEVEKVGVSELILEGGDSADVMPTNLAELNEKPIEAAPISEAAMRKTARHRGTRNEKNG